MFHGPRARPRAAAASLAALISLTATLCLTRQVAADWSKQGDLRGLGGGRVWSVAVSPTNPQVVLAGTDGGVYRSQDGGASWSPTALTGQRVWTVGFDLRQPSPALAGLRGGGVRRSDDGGASWIDASAGLPNLNVRGLAFGLSAVVAATSDGVAVSSDGRSWQALGPHGGDVSSVAVSANQPQITIVAGVDGGDTSRGYLFRNVALGPGWDPLVNGLPATAVVGSVVAGPLAQGAQFRTLVLATNKGTFRSGDGGSTWSESQLPPLTPGGSDRPSITSLGYAPRDPGLVYAGSDAGQSAGGVMLRSTDGGMSFSAADKGLPEGRRNVVSIAVSPQAPPGVVIGLDPPGSGGQIYTETDATVPPAGPVVSENGGALPPVAPRPSASAPGPPPAATPSNEGAGGGVLGFPFPLLIWVALLVGGVYGVLRWRQKRLEVEGPP